MARAALNWSLRDLAKAAGISANTVSRFEGGKPAISATLTVIKQAFEAEGITFIDADETGGAGVRSRVEDGPDLRGTQDKGKV